MTEEEARAIIRAHGWIYQERSPRGVAKYLYARRRKGLRMVERYICPLSQLGNLTEVELVAKLEQPPPAKKI
jgi:hypothetical protein